MSFARKALSFAEDLVDCVLVHYSKERYKPATSDYQLRRKARTSGAVVECAGLFRPVVGRAVVFLQPHFEDKLDEIDCAVYEQAPDYFEPVQFLRFCSLVTLEMGRDYFSKGNFSIPDFTTLFIAKSLSKYHQNGSFRDGDPIWEGQPNSSWAAIYEAARSIMSFKQVLLKSSEFVPEVSPPSTPDPVLPNAQCHPSSILVSPFVRYIQLVY